MGRCGERGVKTPLRAERLTSWHLGICRPLQVYGKPTASGNSQWIRNRIVYVPAPVATTPSRATTPPEARAESSSGGACLSGIKGKGKALREQAAGRGSVDTDRCAK